MVDLEAIVMKCRRHAAVPVPPTVSMKYSPDLYLYDVDLLVFTKKLQVVVERTTRKLCQFKQVG